VGRYSIQSSHRLEADTAAGELVDGVEADFAGLALGGALMLATAAAGQQALQVGKRLSQRWPEAALLGTSFEGILASGRVFRDRPALALLAWAEGPREPLPLALAPDELGAEQIAHEVLAAGEGGPPGPEDLLLLFPDAHGSPGPGAWLRDLQELLGGAAVAGAAATGLGGSPALAWVDGEEWIGSTIGLILPGPGGAGDLAGACPALRSAGASRAASPWLEVTGASGHWVEALEGEPPLDWVRRQLGLEREEAVEPHLRKLLVRIRPAIRPSASGTAGVETDRARAAEADRDFDERYVVGLDAQRGTLSLPVIVARGDEIAFALPDAEVARSELRSAIDRLAPTPWLLQFACRARDEALHGDADLEAALVASHAIGRATVGTVGPLQLGPDRSGRSRLRVHSTVLAAIGAA